jgi:hypothetical protein
VPYQLSFSTEPPAHVLIAQSFTTVVQVRDQHGNPEPAGLLVTIGSTTVPTNASGQAVFSITESAEGTYTLTASVTYVSPIGGYHPVRITAPSSSFTVDDYTETVGISGMPATMTAGQAYTITISVTKASGKPYVGTVVLSNNNSALPVPVTSVQTNSKGQATITVKPIASQNVNGVPASLSFAAGGASHHREHNYLSVCNQVVHPVSCRVHR